MQDKIAQEVQDALTATPEEINFEQLQNEDSSPLNQPVIEKDIGGEVIHVGRNKNYSVNDIIETIEQCWDRKIKSEYIKMRPGEDPIEIVLDNKKLKNLLDYELKWDLTSGMKETIPYYEDAFKNISN